MLHRERSWWLKSERIYVGNLLMSSSVSRSSARITRTLAMVRLDVVEVEVVAREIAAVGVEVDRVVRKEVRAVVTMRAEQDNTK